MASPTDAQYIVGSANADLSAEVLLSTAIGRDTFANRPFIGEDGRLFLPSDSNGLYRNTVSEWKGYSKLFPYTSPVDSDFSWINQGTVTKTTTNGGITLTAPAVAGHVESFAMRVKTKPTPPYTIFASILPNLPRSNYAGCGLFYRFSGAGNLILYRVVFATSVNVWEPEIVRCLDEFGTGLTGSSFANGGGRFPTHLCLREDANLLEFGFSNDGINFCKIGELAKIVLGTPDQVGFFIGPVGTDGAFAFDTSMTLLSWREA